MYLLIKLHKTEALRCPRCVKASDAVEELPSLITFSDHSKIAYGACAYIQWKTNTGEHICSLLAAKNSIAQKKITIRPTKLCGAFLASRLQERFGMTVHLIDSMIIQVQIQKESFCFKLFVATRLLKIEEETNLSEWLCIPSDQNPADITTCIAN